MVPTFEMVSTDNTDDDTSVKDRLMQLQEVIDDVIFL